VWSWPGVIVRGGLCVSYNLKDNMTHPDNLALMKKLMVSLVLVCANTKSNYTHLHDPDAFFARTEHSADPCHVFVEFSTRPVLFKLIFISCLLCLRLTTDFSFQIFDSVYGMWYIYIYIYIFIFIFNRNWGDTRWQQYSSHLHTNNTQNTENGTYISKN
jgi:hypothetical protein